MGVSRRDGNFIMAAISLLVSMAYARSGSSVPQALLGQIPITIETALAQFNLESRTTIYAVCPNCSYTHAPVFPQHSTTATYPETCTHREFPDGSMCGEALLVERVTLDGTRATKPIKPYVYHHFSDYMAGLLSSGEDEAAMDHACDEAMASIRAGIQGKISDFMQGDFVRTFLGPDKNSLFIDRGVEGRYLHAICVDFFDPERLTHRGATTSCGLFSTACLNLGLKVRHKPEKMWVNIIPGPKGPALERLNHFIRPFIEEMVLSWECGVHYSRTALHPEGRTARDAVACVVCDLPGARHAAALAASTSHHYCSICTCHTLSTMTRVDFDQWTRKDKSAMLGAAEAWRDARSSAERNSLFAQSGVRWTEFWRLPYWDPTQQLVVDIMHCIFQGLASFLYRDIMHLSQTSANSRTSVEPAFQHEFQQPKPDELDKKSRKDVALIQSRLTWPLELDLDNLPQSLSPEDDGKLFFTPEKLQSRLAGYRYEALRFVCSDVFGSNSSSNSTRQSLAMDLVAWVSFSSPVFLPC